MGKPVSLQNAIEKKPTPQAAPTSPPEPDTTKHVMIRLNSKAHDVLRDLAYADRCPQSVLLIEALNDFFTKRGKPPIA